MSIDEKIKKLTNKLKTDAEDLYQLAEVIKNDYINEEDVSYIMEDIIKVKDDIIKTVSTLKKEV